MKYYLIISLTIGSILLFGCLSNNSNDEIPIAVVLGKKIYQSQLTEPTKNRNENLAFHIKQPLLEAFIKDNNIIVTEAELKPALSELMEQVDNDFKESAKKHGIDFSDERLKKAKADAYKDGTMFFGEIIKSRKLGKALYEKYGGRVSISSFGFVVAIDSETKYCKEREAAGDFKIYDPEIEKVFWKTLQSEWGDATLSEEEAREMFEDNKYLKFSK